MQNIIQLKRNRQKGMKISAKIKQFDIKNLMQMKKKSNKINQ